MHTTSTRNSPLLHEIGVMFSRIKSKIQQQNSNSDEAILKIQQSNNLFQKKGETTDQFTDRLQKIIITQGIALEKSESIRKTLVSKKSEKVEGFRSGSSNRLEITNELGIIQDQLISGLLESLEFTDQPPLLKKTLKRALKRALIRDLLTDFSNEIFVKIENDLNIDTVEKLPVDLDDPIAIKIQEIFTNEIVSMISRVLPMMDDNKLKNNPNIMKYIREISKATLNLHSMIRRETKKLVIYIPSIDDEYNPKYHKSNNLNVLITEWKTAGLKSESGNFVYIKAAVEVRVEK